MARSSSGRLNTRQRSVEEAKKELRRRSHPVAGAGASAAGSALAETRRRPWRAAGVAFALGVAVGASSTARQALLAGLRRAIARGG
jgi:ElaB/YqjD/DUF883 family membrane-anchored ribosome-binding protein